VTTTIASPPRSAELVGLMDEEIRLYDALLGLARDEREAIVGDDPAVLDGIVAAKESIVAQVARVEMHRQSWVAEWAAEHGADASHLPLSTLIARLTGPEADALAERREQMLARVRELADLNFRNKHLLSSALSIVSRRLDAYERVSTSLGYRPSGQSVKSAGTAVLDMRA
jgi:flagellar biosynthesis/type III secretory pathway chaperone